MSATLVAPSADLQIETHAGAEFFCRQLAVRGFDLIEQPRILVAGCGAGHEAAAIQRRFGGLVDAIDVELNVEPQFRDLPELQVREASVCDQPFAEDSFDAVFYHHVIEHVDNPPRSLQEIARTLRPGGWLFVGTPNRHRLASSVGAHKQTHWESTWRNKLRDNWQDWQARLAGRFRNECGAHAGFSQRELDELLAVHFTDRTWLTRDYLRFKYAGRRLRGLIELATCPCCCWFAAPSIYVLCRKPG